MASDVAERPSVSEDAQLSKRAVGLLIDLTLVVPGVVLMVISVLSEPHETQTGPGSVRITSSEPPSALFWIGWLLALVLFAGDRVVLQGLTGRSLGKRAVGTRLVRMDDKAAVPGIGRAAVRFLFELLGWIDIVVALATQRHQRIGDLTMKTVVIDGSK